MPNCDFNKVAKQVCKRRCSPVSLLHIFRAALPKNTSERLYLEICQNAACLFTCSFICQFFFAEEKLLPKGYLFISYLS